MESFRESFAYLKIYFIEYLQELSDTGSFPEESEKTPMCYIKCYLESVGVLKEENVINKEKAVEFYQLDSDDLVEECMSKIGELSFKCFAIL